MPPFAVVLLLGLATLLIAVFHLGGLELAVFCLGAVVTIMGLIMFAIDPNGGR